MGLREALAKKLSQEVTGDLFAGTKWAAPRHMTEPLEAYHGTMAKFDEFAPFQHFGTKRSASDRLANLKDGHSLFDKLSGLDGAATNGPKQIRRAAIAPGEHVTISPNPSDDSPPGLAKQLWERGRLNDDEYAYVMEPFHRSESDRFLGRDSVDVTKERLLDLLDQKRIVALRYNNTVEDPGSVSYIVPNPKNLAEAPSLRTALLRRMSAR